MAAALYALAQDELAEVDVASRRFERCVLRFKLACCLWQMHPSEPANLRRSVELVHSTISIVRSLPPSEYTDRSHQLLLLDLENWLGHSYEALGDLPRALDAYSKASVEAQTVDERVAYLARAAGLRVRLRDAQGARELLSLAAGELHQVGDPGVRLLFQRVAEEVGFSVSAGRWVPGPVQEEVFPTRLRELVEWMLLEDDRLRPADLGLIRRYFERALAQAPIDEPQLRHEIFLALTLVDLAEGSVSDADSALKSAEVLEAGITDGRPKLRRRWLAARRELRFGSPDRALDQFREIADEADKVLPAEERLAFAGFYLEALMAEPGAVRVFEVRSLCARALDLLEQALAEKPTSVTRRRQRERFQRIIETIGLAQLISAQQLGVGTGTGQDFLQQTWRLLALARNPELGTASASIDPTAAAHLRQIEADFHGYLRRDLLGLGEVPEHDWRRTLAVLSERELSVLRSEHRRPLATLAPQESGASLAFLQVRDLLESQPLLVLSRFRGRFDFAWVARSEAPVASEIDELGSQPSENLRARGMQLLEARSRAQTGHISDYLPDSLRDLLARRGTAPAVPVAWFVFPDGPLYQVAVETLREASGEPTFGEGRAVQFCLGAAAPRSAGRRLELSRGWLGVGDVPAVGPWPALPYSRLEIRDIAALLGSNGLPVRTLLGSAAQASRLVAALEGHRPAVLHFAVHGIASLESPEAGTLLLADDPESPERELLPFRKIRRLPLAGVDLVVLSVCSSLPGPSGRAAGLEGLAWAFLEAGATQVLASRWPVDDRETARFMTILYRHLLTLPPAEALGRARTDALAAGMSEGQVGAWTLWS